MAYDACMMRAVLEEITRDYIDARVEKVLEPQGDELDLILHTRRTSRRLIFNVGPNAPRMQLSDMAKENPLKAPMFCMQMRKHLAGARLLGAEQPGFDRIAVFRFSAYDEMGFASECRLICEIMGKYANLILTDKDGKILGAMKLVDFSASTVRQVLPGMRYTLPAATGKISPLDADRPLLAQKLAEFSPEKTVEKFITGTLGGVATQIAHELCFRATGGIDTPVAAADAEKLLDTLDAWRTLLLRHDYTPSVAHLPDGTPKDTSYMDITYLGSAVTVTHYPDLAAMFDAYYAERDRAEKIHRRGRDLLTLLANAEGRTEKKLTLQREALLESENAEEYKKFGDLITANIYKIRRGMPSVRVTDYTDESAPEAEIPLDTRLTPAQNAQKMYKLYTKEKHAKEHLTACIAEWERELSYLATVREFLMRAETEDELAEIRDELYKSGYASRMKGYQPPRNLRTKPMEFTTSGGYRLLVGRNNLQNDRLTFKTAEKGDLWFHVKDLPGSHVILFCDGEEPSETDYTEAAAAAAFFSKATGDLVPVDYTRVKNVKKPVGAKPGFVTYKTNFTAFVKPEKPKTSVEKK